MSLIDTLRSDAEKVLEAERPQLTELGGIFSALLARVEVELPGIGERAIEDVFKALRPDEAADSASAADGAGASSQPSPAAGASAADDSPIKTDPAAPATDKPPKSAAELTAARLELEAQLRSLEQQEATATANETPAGASTTEPVIQPTAAELEQIAAARKAAGQS